MTLFKKTLLFIIAIQTMVVIQLSSIKSLNLRTEFNQFYNTLTFQTSPTLPKMSPEEYQFFSTLSSSSQTTLKKYNNHLMQNKIFTLGHGYIRQAIKDDVELTAKSLLGRPYVWGATGPNKFDCSGFTQKVFSKVGIRIPRNSRAQAKVGQYIDFHNLKRGDMVFFETNKKRPGYITHVGIYLSEGKFIHASSGGKRVMISSLIKSNYYKHHFVLGRRIILGHKTKHIAQTL
jgi:cell wall-associated NlpC family hydrolase